MVYSESVDADSKIWMCRLIINLCLLLAIGDTLPCGAIKKILEVFLHKLTFTIDYRVVQCI